MVSSSSSSLDKKGIEKKVINRLLAIWIYARPTLTPFNYSLSIQSGDEGFAAFVGGSYNLFAPESPSSGYTDGGCFVYREFREALTVSRVTCGLSHP